MARNLLFEFEVEMVDGQIYQVVGDQRDIARWEVQPFGCGFAQYEQRAMLFCRYIAWSASTRQQLTTLPWDDWSEECLEVTSLEELPKSSRDSDITDRGAGLPDDAGDPGRTAR